MLRIVEVHPASAARGEYVVLQNEGLMTVSIKGWALCTDAYLNGDLARIADTMYVFREDIALKPYMRVVLFTGHGENGWVPTIDGKQAYCAYWRRSESVWANGANVHLLQLLTSRKVVPAFSPAETTSAFPA